jgi:hypothetical protein
MSRRHRRNYAVSGAAAPFDPSAYSGLVIDLDARDLSAGAIASWTDRKNGYVFTGTATRASALNGNPSVTFNGTSNVLTSTASISQMSGASACTMFVLSVSASAPAATRIMVEYGTGAAAGGYFVGTTNTYGAGIFPHLYSGGLVNISGNARDLSYPIAFGGVGEFSPPATAGAPQTNTIQINQRTTSITNGLQQTVTGTMPSTTMSIGARSGGSSYWDGNISRILLYNQRLSAGDILAINTALVAQGGIVP